MSVDLRVASVITCKWVCEALFAGLLEKFYTSPNGPMRELGPRDFSSREGLLSDRAEEEAKFVASNIKTLLQRCRMPRSFPFDSSMSDGMHKVAHLSFLVDKGFLADPNFFTKLPISSTHVGVNGLVSLSTKLSGAEMVLSMVSQSALSTIDYLKFSLYCPVLLYDAVNLLIQKGAVLLTDLVAINTSGNSGKTKKGTKEEDCVLLLQLLRVLVHGNVLYVEESANSPTLSEFENLYASSGKGGKKRKT